MCYNHAYIDFSLFSTALIIGKKENNDGISNGVGKTSIFKAIEYGLFNYSNFNIENIIRNDEDLCSITIDFSIDEQEYRIARKRTAKGITDLTLFSRTTNPGTENEVYHTSIKNPISDKTYWKDMSGRRTADTEKELNKLLKINIKSFRNFVHFIQHDFSGLTTSTPEKRKAILREALNLVIYSKLEKIAKEKLDTISKEVIKFQLLIEAFNDPDASIQDFKKKLILAEKDLSSKSASLNNLEANKMQITDKLNNLINQHSDLEKKFSSLIVKEQLLIKEKETFDRSVKEYTSKRSEIIKTAQSLISQVKELENIKIKLQDTDFTQITLLTEQIVSNKEKIAQLNLTIKNDTFRSEKLKKPIPQDGECEECHQIITQEHRLVCQQKLNQERKEKLSNIQSCQDEVFTLTNQNTANQVKINTLTTSKQQLENVNIQSVAKSKELADKRLMHEEYKVLLDASQSKLADKNKEIEQIAIELKNSSVSEANIIKKNIQEEKQNVFAISNNITTLSKELTSINNNIAVLQHNITQKQEEKQKKLDYTKLLKELEAKIPTYQSVIQAFSSTGIPNLIIQNVLEDLQEEANNLLTQLKPEIQLSFLVEKVDSKGEDADTLDILYLVNGRKRCYEQLSGAMQLAVTFSLKLGLSFLLQRMLGVDIQFLLLDEIDQSLDKAGIDALSDIIRFLQKQFTILVITHNDTMKSHFHHSILVEQDINMVSHAKVVSSY